MSKSVNGGTRPRPDDKGRGGRPAPHPRTARPRDAAVRARPRWLRVPGVSRSKSGLYRAFVWARGALNCPKRRLPARAGGQGRQGGGDGTEADGDREQVRRPPLRAPRCVRTETCPPPKSPGGGLISIARPIHAPYSSQGPGGYAAEVRAARRRGAGLQVCDYGTEQEGYHRQSLYKIYCSMS